MENKETSLEALNEICKECNRASVCDKTYGTCPNYNKIYDDLKELEQYREIIGTPIQDIMKRLKVLEILKERIYISKGQLGNYLNFFDNSIDDDEDDKLIKEYFRK